MTKIKIFFMSLTVLFSGTSFALAQENSPATAPPPSLEEKNKLNAPQSEIIATVDIYNAQVVYQSRNNLRIAFTISNREKLQPGIRYAVFLNKKGDSNVAASRVFDETVTLGPNETSPKVIDYAAPSYLDGTYQVWVVSQSDKGLVLGQGSAGEVTLSGRQENYVLIDRNSCYLTVEGEEGGKKYTLGQGVDTSEKENLILTCDYTNYYPHQVTLQPDFKAYYRTVFGSSLETTDGDNLIFEANEKKTISLKIPKEKKPQAYDVELSLIGTARNIASNSIVIHYVVQGVSATVKNAQLDKDYYSKGDTALLNVSWSGSSDIFFGSRSGKNDADQIFLDSYIESDGKKCGEIKGQKLENAGHSGQAKLSIPVSMDCWNPQIKMMIKDKDGNILDESMYSFVSKNKPQLEKTSRSPRNIILVIVLLLLVLAVAIYAAVKKGKDSNVPTSLLFLLAFGTIWILLGRQAQAVTFTAYTSCPGYDSNADYAVSTDRYYYSPGSYMVFTGSGSVASCANGDWISGVYTSKSGTVYYIQNGGTAWGQVGAWAEGSPGVYSAWTAGWVYAPYGAACHINGWYYGPNVTWEVPPPPPPAGDAISASPQVVSYGQGTTISWNSWNAAYCALWGGPWSNTPITPNSAGSAWTGALYSDTTITIGCHNNIDWTWNSVTVPVKPTPVAYISASPNPIDYNGTSTISWSSNVDNNCWLWDDTQTMFNGWAGANGSVVTGNLTGTRGFHVQCYDSLWTPAPQADVYVSVRAAPTASISASPSTVLSGSSATLSWSSTNSSNCWLWDDTQTEINGWMGTSGSRSTIGLTSARGYHAQCYNSAGYPSPQANVTVNVCSPVYTCSHGADNCANLPCGSTGTQTAYCTSSCGGSVPLSNCASCEDIPVSCTACKNPGWKEVTP